MNPTLEAQSMVVCPKVVIAYSNAIEANSVVVRLARQLLLINTGDERAVIRSARGARKKKTLMSYMNYRICGFVLARSALY
jgi:hypothetical protein